VLLVLGIEKALIIIQTLEVASSALNGFVTCKRMVVKEIFWSVLSCVLLVVLWS